MNLEQAKKLLHGASDSIASSISDAMTKRTFSYEIFGKEIEPCALESVKSVFRANGHNNFSEAKDKNEFPDLTIMLEDGNLAVDIKTGNHFKKEKGHWVKCQNSNNDLGTIRSWPKKLEKFGGENIFFVFVEYSITDKTHVLNTVKIAPFYMFLDLNKKGLLKYRKKDGNLRPKNFDSPAVITSYAIFGTLFRKTEVERAKSIIEEHIETLPKNERNILLDKLKLD